MTEFSNRLKRLREEKGWSKTKLAGRIGVSLSTYANWEYGIAEPDIETIKKICQQLDVSSDVLLNLSINNEIQQDDTALTWTDLGMPYGGKIPDELKQTYADLAESYFKRHPEMLNKNNK